MLDAFDLSEVTLPSISDMAVGAARKLRSMSVSLGVGVPDISLSTNGVLSEGCAPTQ